MRIIVFALFVAVFGIGCGSVGSNKIFRNGEAWFTTSCGQMSECYAEASRVCPGTYKEDKEASRPHELLFTCTSGPVHFHQ